ncbi:MAG: hypothetical protein ABI743_12490 [bacterium]
MQFREPESELYVDPKAYTTGLNFPDPSAFKVYDTTLRDGEQTPGVALTPPQKYEIAKLISRMGSHIIDMGFPASDPSEGEALKLVIEGKRKGEIRQDLELLVMCRSNPGDIDATLKALKELGADPSEITFLIFTSASSLHIKYKLGDSFLRRAGKPLDSLLDTPVAWFREQNEQMVNEAIAYAKSQGVTYVEFGSEDASRTPIEQLIKLVQSAVDGGADRYIFPDTTGSLTPEATAFYCDALKAAFPKLEMVSHFHNDYDMGTTNVIMACHHGMPIFSATINGLGERAGNAPLHTVVTALKLQYGITIPGFRYDLLWEARKLVERLTGIPVQVHEPVVGRNVFAHESGIHTHGVLQHPKTYEPIPAELVGGERRFVFGKHSGRNVVRHTLMDAASVLQSRGLTIDEALVEKVLARIKDIRLERAEDGTAEQVIEDLEKGLRKLGMLAEDVIQIALEMAPLHQAAE